MIGYANKEKDKQKNSENRQEWGTRKEKANIKERRKMTREVDKDK